MLSSIRGWKLLIWFYSTNINDFTILSIKKVGYDYPGKERKTTATLIYSMIQPQKQSLIIWMITLIIDIDTWVQII